MHVALRNHPPAGAANGPGVLLLNWLFRAKSYATISSAIINLIAIVRQQRNRKFAFAASVRRVFGEKKISHSLEVHASRLRPGNVGDRHRAGCRNAEMPYAVACL